VSCGLAQVGHVVQSTKVPGHGSTGQNLRQLQQSTSQGSNGSMISIYLGDLQYNKGYEAVRWLCDTYGPGTDRWIIRDLAYVDFRNDRDADLFLLRWA
jgi:hypothetical protein